MRWRRPQLNSNWNTWSASMDVSSSAPPPQWRRWRKMSERRKISIRASTFGKFPWYSSSMNRRAHCPIGHYSTMSSSGYHNLFRFVHYLCSTNTASIRHPVRHPIRMTTLPLLNKKKCDTFEFQDIENNSRHSIKVMEKMFSINWAWILSDIEWRTWRRWWDLCRSTKTLAVGRTLRSVDVFGSVVGRQLGRRTSLLSGAGEEGSIVAFVSGDDRDEQAAAHALRLQERLSHFLLLFGGRKIQLNEKFIFLNGYRLLRGIVCMDKSSRWARCIFTSVCHFPITSRRR